MMERPTATFQGILERDSAGYWHFKEGEFEKAPDWMRFIVGLMNEETKAKE